MDIEKFTSKILDKIAKTKEDSLLFGGLFVGFALGMAFFGFEDNFDFGLIDILEVLIVSTLLFSGVLLVVERSRYAAGKIKDSVYYPYLPNSGHL